MEINKNYNENCIETMARMGDGFIDLTVTSPPYDNLRSYKGYTFDFEPIAKELFRVTKPGGCLVWVVGDSTKDGNESGTSFKQALFFKSIGFKLHDTMIYEKSPSYPSGSHSTRYSQAFEYMFVFSKGKIRTANLLQDRKNRWAGNSSFGTQSERLKNGDLKKRKIIEVKEWGVRFNIWKYATGKNFTSEENINHPAMFPEKLAGDHILSWSNENDLIYDPFSGSGTTGKMSALNNRNFIGSEISKDYCDIANARLKTALWDDL